MVVVAVAGRDLLATVVVALEVPSVDRFMLDREFKK